MAHKTRNRYGLARPFDAVEFSGILADALGYPRRELSDLVRTDMPTCRTDRRRFRDEFLLKEVVRKYPGFNLGVDTRKVALESFLDDERLNRETNERLLSSRGVTPRVSQIIDLAGRKIGKILGPFSWSLFEDGLRFGPGATTSRSHKQASVHSKLQGDIFCTSKALPLWDVCLKTRPLWKAELAGLDASTSVFESDVLLVVPKNALTGRTIGKGNDANVMMQLALGYCLRSAMFHREGINLNDQSINQRRALAGSVSGHLATVDFKSASNSVTTGIVYRLLGNLPDRVCDPRWYQVLDALRVEQVLIENRVHRYELFSCMGNGATFELESLIFYSIAWATCAVLGVEPDCSIYGDDLILPSVAVDLLTEVCDYCGFRINTSKSFSDPSGGFRESCGKCYLDGFDVTAFYLDKPVTDALDIFILANNIVRWASGPYGRDGRMLPVWEWVVSHLPRRLRSFVGPLGDSDSHLIMDFDEAHSFVRSIRNPGCAGISGYSGMGLERVPLQNPVDDRVAYLSCLYRTSYRKFSLPKSDTSKRTVFLPGRRKTGSGYEGRNVYVSLDIPSVPPAPSNNIEGRCVLHEKRTRFPVNWPMIGPWLCESSTDEVRVALLRLHGGFGGGSSPPSSPPPGVCCLPLGGVDR